MADHVVMTLCEPLHFSGVNVTTENGFTNTKLAAELLKKQITLLGTMRRNKPDIPMKFTLVRQREVISSLGFSDQQTLLSYIPKKSNVVI